MNSALDKSFTHVLMDPTIDRHKLVISGTVTLIRTFRGCGFDVA